MPIGYFYNFTGPTRPNATIQWTAQPMTLWGGAYNHSTTNGNAYKVFADSNGDGVINNADQAAIGFNMSKIQARLAAPKTVTKNFFIFSFLILPREISFRLQVNLFVCCAKPPNHLLQHFW